MNPRKNPTKAELRQRVLRAADDYEYRERVWLTDRFGSDVRGKWTNARRARERFFRAVRAARRGGAL